MTEEEKGRAVGIQLERRWNQKEEEAGTPGIGAANPTAAWVRLTREAGVCRLAFLIQGKDSKGDRLPSRTLPSSTLVCLGRQRRATNRTFGPH